MFSVSSTSHVYEASYILLQCLMLSVTTCLDVGALIIKQDFQVPYIANSMTHIDEIEPCKRRRI
jgi:ethanolamine utilization protein EutA (predicted chaperonin)